MLGITKEDALATTAEKRRKEDELSKREHNMYMKFWRSEKNEILTKGIITRKDEKARINRVKEYTNRGIEVPDEDKYAIVDPEVEWKATNPIWLAEEARKAQLREKSRSRPDGDEDEEDDENFIIDTVGDRDWVLWDAIADNDDYVGFEETDSSDKDVQMQMRPDRGLIEVQFPHISLGYED